MTNDVQAWIDAGLYDPDAADADDRLELLRYLTEKGATFEDLVHSEQSRSINAAASDRLLAPAKTISRDEAVARLGLTLEQLDRAWLSVGLPPVPDTGPAFSDGDMVLLEAIAVGVDLLGFDATLQFSRVMGSSLARIADAAVSGFLVNVEGPLVEEHSTPVDLARASFEATEILKTLPDVFAPIFLHHAALATMRTRATRDATRGYAEFRLSVCFLDLVDYTAWSRGLSTADLARAVNDFEETANDRITEHGARIVKNIGDAVMFVSVDDANACDTALSLCDYVDRHASLTQLRGAVATGSLLSRDGDYFGATVNLAARAVKVAEAGEVVADRPVDGFNARPLGPQLIRGFDEPVELFVISR